VKREGGFVARVFMAGIRFDFIFTFLLLVLLRYCGLEVKKELYMASFSVSSALC
jgi:hypothetical protein